MFRRYSVNFAILSVFLDAGLTALAFRLAVHLRTVDAVQDAMGLVPIREAKAPAHLYLVIPVVWITVFLIFSAYDGNRIYRVVDEFQIVSLAVGFATLIFTGLLFWIGAYQDVSRALVLLFIIIDYVLLFSWRAMVRIGFKIMGNDTSRKRVIIVGAGEVGQQVAAMIRKYGNDRLKLVGFLDDNLAKNGEATPLCGGIDDVRRVVINEQIEDIIIALPRYAYSRINQIVFDLHDCPVHVRVVPDYFNLALSRAQVENFGGLPLINLRDPALSQYQRIVKRLFDIAVAGVSLIAVSPVMLMVALAIKLDSRGPILFSQERVGENGRFFYMHKFRSMVPNAEALQASVNTELSNGELVHKRKDDPRVTRIGRFIRRTSLDELPQLFNVIKGDMSLVGPRPELPWLVEKYDYWQRKRFAVPQGITGWWQVNGRSNKLMHTNTQDDLYYIQNYSLWMDLYILLKTPWVVLRGKGAY